MKTKTEELIGPALDWAVAQCEGKALEGGYAKLHVYDESVGDAVEWNPSANWAQAGPIIEREDVGMVRCNDLYFPQGNEKGQHWEPLYKAYNQVLTRYGPSSLIAAMRCYVTAKLGEDVDLPPELM